MRCTMLKKLSGFLDENPIESLITYDIKNESPWDEVHAEKNPIQKMKKYRDGNKNTSLSFDCDNSNGTCDFVDSIYQELWGWSYKNRMRLSPAFQNKFNNYWDRLGSDTMNSFSTIYRQALKINADDKSAVKHNKHLQEFATLTHTIGNLTLVPFKIDSKKDTKSFNQYRGFRDNDTNKYFVYDFFDLSLKIIKESVNEQTFKAYIDAFHLQDFVHPDDNYRIKPLLKKHKSLLAQNKMPLDNPESFLPENNEELNEYLMNVNKLIKQRSKRIVNVLKNNLDTTNIDKVTMQPKRKMNKVSKTILTGSILLFLSFIVAFIGVLRYVDMNEIGIKNAIEQHGLWDVSREFIQAYTTLILKFSLYIFIAFIILIKVVSIGINIALDKLGRCKSCKKLFALKKIQTNLINVADISIKKELKRRNSNGEVIGTSEQYIPGTKKTYETIHQCKHCKHKQFGKYSRTVENT